MDGNENNRCLLELHYLPCVQYLSKFIACQRVMIEACENYQKGSFRNRCRVLGPQGVSRLSVPLEKGKHQQMPVTEVRISYDWPWYARHWRAIETGYGSAPFFSHYQIRFRSVLYEKHTRLFELNSALLDIFLDEFQLSEYILTSSYNADDEVMDLREHIHPKRPVPDPAFRPVEYLQVFADRMTFKPNLSALDLLFCCGPTGREILERSVSG